MALKIGKSIIELPAPKSNKSDTVFNVLKKRETVREISDKKIPLQIISNLLWAANGVNREKGPFRIAGRTAASASNSQEIDIFAVMEEGIFLYDAFKNCLIQVAAGDLRHLSINVGQSEMITGTPLNLIYVADVDKLVHTSGFQEPGLHDPEVQKSYYFVDTGLIDGNVYLYAASIGLASWFHNCNRKELEQKLKLRSDQHVLFGQTIGYPA